MTRRRLLPLVLLLVLGGIFGWWWYQPERVLARRVASLFSAANVAAADGTITRTTRGNAIEPFLAPNILFETPDGPTEEIAGSQSRSSIVSLYSYLAKESRQISIQAPQFDRIEIDGDEAVVEARVDALIDLPNASRPLDGIQHLTMTWRKIDGKWRLAAARWHETGR